MAPDPTAIVAIAGLILVKEIGVPVPVPGDLVVLGAGVAASRGDLDGRLALAALIIASIVGGSVQFGLLRSVGRPLAIRLLNGLGTGSRIEAYSERFRRGGARGVAVARATPGLRIVAIAASALAGVPAIAFLVGLIVGNGVFIAAHFALGYVLGEPVLAVVGGALGPLAAVGIVLGVVGAIGWSLVARRRRSGSGTALAWSDACCPACLTLAVAQGG